MKTTFPAVLFVCGLISLTGISTAKAAEKVVEDPFPFSVICLSYGIPVVNEVAVKISYRHPDNHFIEMITSDNREIITAAECTLTQIKPSKKVSINYELEDKKFPEDGEPRYSIGY